MIKEKRTFLRGNIALEGRDRIGMAEGDLNEVIAGNKLQIEQPGHDGQELRRIDDDGFLEFSGREVFGVAGDKEIGFGLDGAFQELVVFGIGPGDEEADFRIDPVRFRSEAGKKLLHFSLIELLEFRPFQNLFIFGSDGFGQA